MSTNISKQQLFDRDSLLSALGDADNVTLCEFYTLFLEHTQRSWQVLVNASVIEDWETVKTVAHSLKSSSKSIGANAFAALMAKLEEHADSVNPDRCDVETADKVLQSTVALISLRLQELAP